MIKKTFLIIVLLSLLLVAPGKPVVSQTATAGENDPLRTIDLSHFEQQAAASSAVTPAPAVDEALGLPPEQAQPMLESDPLSFEINSGRFVYDDFNRIDGAIGAGWTVHNGYCNIASNSAVCGGVSLPGRATFNGVSTDGNMAEMDVAVSGTSLQYAGLLLNYGAGVNNLFIKVQQQAPFEGKFTHAACYTGSGGIGFGLNFFELTSPFMSAHMSARRVGDTVTLVFSNVDGSTQPTQTYTCTGAPPPEGSGIGILGYNAIARMDNFGVSNKHILLVDDDWDFDETVPNDGGRPYYTTALDILGYSYAVWDTVTQGSPTTADMLPYDAVIWFTGYAWEETVLPSDELALAGYLEAGGVLILSSLDYIYSAGTVTPFMRDYLGISSYDEDVTELDPVGTPDSPIGVELGPYTLVRPDTWAAYWPGVGYEGPYTDYVYPTPENSAPFKFWTSGVTNSSAFDGGHFRTVFLAWPFEWVGFVLDRAEILGSMLEWGHWVAKSDACFDLTRFDAEYFPRTGLVYVLGGRSGIDTDGNIYAYNPSTGACIDTGADMPIPISNFTTNLINDGSKDLLCTFGGREAGGSNTLAVQCYDPLANNASVVANLPAAYTGYVPGAQVVYNNRVYIFGGFNSYAAPYDLARTDRYNPITKSFTQLGNLSLARSYIYAAEVAGKIYAFGGTISDPGGLLAQTRAEVMADPEGAGTWNDAAVPDLPSPMGEGRAFGFDSADGIDRLTDKIVFVGGGDWPNETGDGWTYDTLTHTYDVSFPDLQEFRRDHAGVYVPLDSSNQADGLPGLWVIGGHSGSDAPPYAGVEYFPLNYNFLYAFLPLVLK